MQLRKLLENSDPAAIENVIALQHQLQKEDRERQRLRKARSHKGHQDKHEMKSGVRRLN